MPETPLPLYDPEEIAAAQEQLRVRGVVPAALGPITQSLIDTIYGNSAWTGHYGYQTIRLLLEEREILLARLALVEDMFGNAHE